jgi:hypothetical protein
MRSLHADISPSWHTHTQAKWSITQIHKIHDTNLPASALTPFSSAAKVMRDPEGRGLMLLANAPHSLQQQQRSSTSSSSLPLLPIASPSFVNDCHLALLEASCRAAGAAAEADDSNSNWSSTAVMTESHASNPPPPPQPQPRMSRGTTLAERWMSL